MFGPMLAHTTYEYTVEEFGKKALLNLHVRPS